ncbi:MAG: hypothetical protein HY660_13040 [Armatimonadetes bacterium]|nr:hypothetical protein [Armatimonadota bacterium]
MHRALDELARYVAESAQAYLVLYLHEAVVAALFSRWAAYEDDARGVIALEVARRARNALAHGLIEPAEVTRKFGAALEEALKKLSPPKTGKRAPPTGAPPKGPLPKVPPELVTFIAGRVLEDLAGEYLRDGYLSRLERLRSGFGLTQHELARLLEVTPEATRKWVRGGGISPDARGLIDLHLALLERLETYVRPGLLPAILRRPARGLGGRRPAELLLEGQGETIAEYLEALTTYASTA